MKAVTNSRLSRLGGNLVIGLTLFFLLGPLIAMLIFSLRFPLTGQWTGRAWSAIFSGGESDLTNLWQGVTNSLWLAVFTVVLMLVLLLPTMLALRLLRTPLSRVVEFVCLLPLALPAIVLVVGLAPIYRFISINLLNTDAIWLAFAYVILVLPYSYRALDAGFSAIPIKTMVEAARSLGASWPRVLFSVVVPNLRQAIASASFISVAVVLGEFTIASLLNRNNLQVAVFLLGQSDSMTATAVALLAMLFGVVLLVALDLISHYLKGKKIGY
ncbi:ABC transporter permease subunit [Actinomycetaceae bacterium TAE3-ERU4]|nr:ABC transporter permease subunit [Actinomycetaceae bacterium TAE3-ERU4]